MFVSTKSLRHTIFYNTFLQSELFLEQFRHSRKCVSSLNIKKKHIKMYCKDYYRSSFWI